jgi:hypothetical protein
VKVWLPNKLKTTRPRGMVPGAFVLRGEHRSAERHWGAAARLHTGPDLHGKSPELILPGWLRTRDSPDTASIPLLSCSSLGRGCDNRMLVLVMPARLVEETLATHSRLTVRAGMLGFALAGLGHTLGLRWLTTTGIILAGGSCVAGYDQPGAGIGQTRSTTRSGICLTGGCAENPMSETSTMRQRSRDRLTGAVIG